MHNLTKDKDTKSNNTRTADSAILQTESHNTVSINLKDLHAKMGHIAAPSVTWQINKILGCNKVTNKEHIDLTDCKICLRRKFKNKYKKSMKEHVFNDLEKVSSNIYGLITPSTCGSYRYFITLLDIET